MYLYARKSISSIEWEPKTYNKKMNADFTILTSLVGATDWVYNPEDLAFASVSIQVGYWRKVNAVHNWFIQELANGVDECQPIYVPRSSLIDLKNACEIVLRDHSQADAILPTGSGFFFGSTEYDEWYFYGLEKTVKIVTKLIEDVPEGWAFEYQASW